MLVTLQVLRAIVVPLVGTPFQVYQPPQNPSYRGAPSIRAKGRSRYRRPSFSNGNPIRTHNMLDPLGVDQRYITLHPADWRQEWEQGRDYSLGYQNEGTY